MRVNTKVVIDIETNEVELRESYTYFGPIESAKGDGKAGRMADEQWAIEKQEIDRQRALQDQIKGSFSKYMNGDIGFDPTQLAILNSQFLDQNARNFDDASGMIRSALSSRGSGTGDGPASGDFVRGLTALASARASDRSTGLANIKLADLQQALANKFNAGNLLSGQAAQMGNTIGNLGAGANSALGNYIKSQQSGFGAAFMNTLGAGLAKVATGFAGGMAKNFGGKYYDSGSQQQQQ